MLQEMIFKKAHSYHGLKGIIQSKQTDLSPIFTEQMEAWDESQWLYYSLKMYTDSSSLTFGGMLTACCRLM